MNSLLRSFVLRPLAALTLTSVLLAGAPANFQSAYGSPHHVEWTPQSKASDSGLGNGKVQPRGWDSQGRLTIFQTIRAAEYAVGHATSAYPGKLERSDRHIVFPRPKHTGGEAIIVIRDELRFSNLTTFQFLMHARPRMDVNAETQRVDLAQGNARSRIEYLTPGGLILKQNDRFPQHPINPAPNQSHLVTSTVGPVREPASLIAFQPHHAGSVLLVPLLISGNGCRGSELADGERTLTVLFRINALERSRLPAMYAGAHLI